MSFKSNLSKAKGLGSSKNGVHHWKLQRLSAFAMIPLTLWLMYSFTFVLEASQNSALEFFGSSFNAVMMILFITFSFYHASLGLQVVIEDYIHKKWLKYSSLIFIKLGSLALAIYAALMIVKIHLN